MGVSQNRDLGFRFQPPSKREPSKSATPILSLAKTGCHHIYFLLFFLQIVFTLRGSYGKS